MARQHARFLAGLRRDQVVHRDPARHRHAADRCVHRVHHELRAPRPRPVRQACGRPQDVRWSEHVPADQGQHVRRSADHLRAVHCDAPRDDRCLHRHRQQLLLDLDEHLYLRHEERVLHRLLLPADHCVQLLLCNDSVQPNRNRQ